MRKLTEKLLNSGELETFEFRNQFIDFVKDFGIPVKPYKNNPNTFTWRKQKKGTCYEGICKISGLSYTIEVWFVGSKPVYNPSGEFVYNSSFTLSKREYAGHSFEEFTEDWSDIILYYEDVKNLEADQKKLSTQQYIEEANMRKNRFHEGEMTMSRARQMSRQMSGRSGFGFEANDPEGIQQGIALMKQQVRDMEAHPNRYIQALENGFVIAGFGGDLFGIEVPETLMYGEVPAGTTPTQAFEQVLDYMHKVIKAADKARLAGKSDSTSLPAPRKMIAETNRSLKEERNDEWSEDDSDTMAQGYIDDGDDIEKANIVADLENEPYFYHWADEIEEMEDDEGKDDAQQEYDDKLDEIAEEVYQKVQSLKKESLDESEGVEVYPEDGKLKAVRITKDIVSSKTKNKLSDLKTKDSMKKPTPLQAKATRAILKDLKSKGKLSDISKSFDIDPKPDITFKANGDAVVTPDKGKKSYEIPAKEVEKFEEAATPLTQALSKYLTKLGCTFKEEGNGFRVFSDNVAEDIDKVDAWISRGDWNAEVCEYEPIEGTFFIVM